MAGWENFLVLTLPNFESKWENIATMVWEGCDDYRISSCGAEAVSPYQVSWLDQQRFQLRVRTIKNKRGGAMRTACGLGPAAVSCLHSSDSAESPGRKINKSLEHFSPELFIGRPWIQVPKVWPEWVWCIAQLLPSGLECPCLQWVNGWCLIGCSLISALRITPHLKRE